MTAAFSMMDTAIDGLSDLASANIVTGAPVDIDGKQVVPILALCLGFGGAGGAVTGEGNVCHKSHGAPAHGGTGKGTGTGSCAGGGARLIPVALLIRDNKGVRVVRVPRPKKGIEKIFEKFPGWVEQMKGA